MSGPAALLDSNVIIACLAEKHQHHAASLPLLTTGDRAKLAISAHSFAEAYSTLTRGGDDAPFGFTAIEAHAALGSVRAITALVGLTPAQTFDVIGRYADSGGIGPGLYDALIGEAAIVQDIPVIITWNTRHMNGLFPMLRIVTPTRYLASLR